MGQFRLSAVFRASSPSHHPPGAILFVTYRLAGSIPKSTVREYKAKKEWLDEQLRRAQEASLNYEATEVSACLERVEKFNRDWFLKFEDILHSQGRSNVDSGRARCGPGGREFERIGRQDIETRCVLNHVESLHAVFKPFISETNLKEAGTMNAIPFLLVHFPAWRESCSC